MHKADISLNGDGPQWFLTAFGLHIASDFALPGAQTGVPAPIESGSRSIYLRWVALEELPAARSEARRVCTLLAFDGLGYAMLEGTDSSMLFLYGREARFLFSPERRELKCWAAHADDARWQRVLLDTVLWTISLLHGFQLLHASAVQTRAGVLAVTAATGGGKSSLAAEMLQRGGRLFSDDVVALDEPDELGGTSVRAYPGPRLMNVPAAIDLDALPGLQPIASFADETWVYVEGEPPDPQPLAGIVLLERRTGTELRCDVKPATSLMLLTHMQFLIDLYDAKQDRTRHERRRFELAADLAQQVPVIHLTAPSELPPSRLLDALEPILNAL